MPDPVPVASNLLESKFLGFSVRRLLESVAGPIAPCAILYTVGFPLAVTLPLFVVGLGVGALIFVQTPPGQRPLRYAHAVARHRTGTTVYTWARLPGQTDDLASGPRQDDWLTQPGGADGRGSQPQGPTNAVGQTPPNVDTESLGQAVEDHSHREAR